MSIVYIVTTTGKYHATRVEAIRASWAAEIEFDVLYMSDAPSTISTVMNLKCPPDYTSASVKTVFGLQAIKGTEYAAFDWVVVCDDDSLMLTDRLEQFLATQDPKKAVCYGRRINDFPPFPDLFYPQGGAGYVLSNAALQKLHGVLLSAKLYVYSDVTIGVILKDLGIPVVHVEGFNAHPPEKVAKDESPEALQQVLRNALSFHYIPPERMIELYQTVLSVPHEPKYGAEIEAQEIPEALN